MAGSIYLGDGTVSSGTLTTTKSGGFITSGGTWTVEALIYLTGYPSVGSFYVGAIVSTVNASNQGWYFGVEASSASGPYDTIELQNHDGTVGVYAPYSFQLNRWYHVAAVCVSGTIYFYVNGTVITPAGSGTFSFTESNTLKVGYRAGASQNYYLPARVTNIRIVNGTAVYTANFAPPKTSLPSIANTVLLLDVLSAETYLTDSSPNKLAVTVNSGAPVYSSLTPYVSDSTKFITPTLVNTTDIPTSTWTTYNLQGVVPSSATGAMFNIIRGAAGSQVVTLRKNGSTDSYIGITLNADTQNYFLSALDASLKFQVYAGSTDFQLYCIGYFNEEATFFTNGQVLSALPNSWTDYNISAYVPSTAIAAILTTDTNSYNTNVRKKGSTDDLTNGNEYANKKFFIVGLDSAQTFQAIGVPANGESLVLLGYMTSGIVWNTNAIRRTITSNNIFQSLPVSATAAGYLYLINAAATIAKFSLRKSGNYGSDANLSSTASLTQYPVGASPEFRTSNTADQFIYELGYFTSPAMRMYSNNAVKITNMVESNINTIMDNFNRADESPMLKNWVTAYGLGLKISSNKVKANTFDDTSWAIWNTNTNKFSANQSSAITISNQYPYDIDGVVVLGSSGGTGYVVAVESTDQNVIHIYKYINNTSTNPYNLYSPVPFFTANTGRLAVTSTVYPANTTLDVYIDGVKTATYVDSSSPITQGQPGIKATWGNSNVTELDDWVGTGAIATTTAYNFANANNTLITADDPNWQSSSGSGYSTYGTITTDGLGRGKVGTNADGPARIYQAPATGPVEQSSQIWMYPTIGPGAIRSLITQANSTSLGYVLKTYDGSSTGSGTNIELYKANGTAYYLTGNAAIAINLAASYSTVKMKTNILTKSVKVWVANNFVADAEVSGSLAINYTDPGTALLGGYPGIFISDLTSGNSTITNWTNFAPKYIVGNASPNFITTTTQPQGGGGQTYTYGGLQWFTAGYVSPITGSANTAYISINSAASVEIKVVVYDSSLSKVGEATFPNSLGTGLLSSKFDTPFSVVAGKTYYIAMSANTVYWGGYIGSGASWVCKGYDLTATGVIPTTLPVGAGDADSPEMSVYFTVDPAISYSKLYANGTYVTSQFIEQ